MENTFLPQRHYTVDELNKIVGSFVDEANLHAQKYNNVLADNIALYASNNKLLEIIANHDTINRGESIVSARPYDHNLFSIYNTDIKYDSALQAYINPSFSYTSYYDMFSLDDATISGTAGAGDIVKISYVGKRILAHIYTNNPTTKNANIRIKIPPYDSNHIVISTPPGFEFSKNIGSYTFVTPALSLPDLLSVASINLSTTLTPNMYSNNLTIYGSNLYDRKHVAVVEITSIELFNVSSPKTISLDIRATKNAQDYIIQMLSVNKGKKYTSMVFNIASSEESLLIKEYFDVIDFSSGSIPEQTISAFNNQQDIYYTLIISDPLTPLLLNNFMVKFRSGIGV